MLTSPASGSGFFGRESFLALFRKRLSAFQNGFRQNLAFLGQLHIGKSSLLEQFAEHAQDCQVITVPFQFQPSEPFERFSNRWMSEILFSYYQGLNKPIPADFQVLFRALKGYVPKTLRRMKWVKRLARQGKYPQAYRELLSLGGTIFKETGKKVLFLLDDFDLVGTLSVSDPFGPLASEIMIQKESMFVAMGARTTASRAIFTDKLALLFGNFELVDLEPFDFREASAFMRERLPSVEGLSGDLKRFLIRLTDGHPYYLQVILQRVASGFLNAEKNLTDGVIRAMIQELYEPAGAISQHLSMKLRDLTPGRNWVELGDILYAIVQGDKKISKIHRRLRLKTNVIKKCLERLVATDVLERHGTLYMVRDPMMRFWILHVYYRRRFISRRAPQASEQSFSEDVQELMKVCERVSQQEFPKRVEELLKRFRNDTVTYRFRRLLCPSFTEVVSKPNNGRVFPVYARNDRTRWLCQILVNPITEEDVHVFRQDLKRVRSRINKRFLIGLKGIDLNAKLLAQEAKIQYLDLRQINFLMDVFDQPKIVV